jgi:hypothetical protein
MDWETNRFSGVPSVHFIHDGRLSSYPATWLRQPNPRLLPALPVPGQLSGLAIWSLAASIISLKAATSAAANWAKVLMPLA